jgi:hypothetical protein
LGAEPPQRAHSTLLVTTAVDESVLAGWGAQGSSAKICARPSFFQLSQTRRARAAGDPAHLVVHEDVGVFAKPAGAAR